MAKRGRGRRVREALAGPVAAAAGLALGVVACFPVIYCVCAAFKTRAELAAWPPRLFPETFSRLDNFRDAFATAPLLRYMVNSLVVSSLGGGLRIAFAALAAYAFAYFAFPLKKTLFMIALGTMMLPADTLVVTNYLTVARLGLLDTALGMCVTSLAGASQLFMLRQAFRTIPPSLREAAFMDGCGDLRYLAAVAAPLSGPVLFTLLTQSFVNLWNAYLWPLLVTNRQETRTVQVGLAMLTNPLETNYTLVLAGVTVLLVPSAALFALLRAGWARDLGA